MSAPSHWVGAFLHLCSLPPSPLPTSSLPAARSCLLPTGSAGLPSSHGLCLRNPTGPAQALVASLGAQVAAWPQTGFFAQAACSGLLAQTGERSSPDRRDLEQQMPSKRGQGTAMSTGVTGGEPGLQGQHLEDTPACQGWSGTERPLCGQITGLGGTPGMQDHLRGTHSICDSTKYVTLAKSWPQQLLGTSRASQGRGAGGNGKRRRCQLCVLPSRRFSGKQCPLHIIGHSHLQGHILV